MYYGEVRFEGKEIILTSIADFTNRMLYSNNMHEVEEGETFEAEMSAEGIDEEGNRVVVYWIFSFIKGAETDLDCLNYSEVDRVTYE